MDQQYFQNHMAHIRIIRRNKEILFRLQQHQHPPPQDQNSKGGQDPSVPPVLPPIVVPPLPPQIVVMPQPPVAHQDIHQLPEVLPAVQLQTPQVQENQEQVPQIPPPPPPPVKVHPLDLPIPAEVKRTNLSDSFEQEEEEKIIVPVIFDEEVPMATSTSTQVGQVQQSTTIKEPHPPIQTSHSIQVLIQLHVVA